MVVDDVRSEAIQHVNFDFGESDVKLLHAIENNAGPQVIELLARGADPHALIPVHRSQFRSTFRDSNCTHVSAAYRALSLYEWGELTGRIFRHCERLERIPTAYVSVNTDRWDPDNSLVETRSQRRPTSLFSAITESLSSEIDRREATGVIAQCLSTTASEPYYMVAEEARRLVHQYMAGAPLERLERALHLLDDGVVFSNVPGLGADIGKISRVEHLDGECSVALTVPLRLMHAKQAVMAATVIELLIDSGAMEIDALVHGMTPLHWACYFGALEAAEVLLLRGADPLKSTDALVFHDELRLRTAVEVAVRSKSVPIQTLLHAFLAYKAVQSTIQRSRSSARSTAPSEAVSHRRP